MSPVTSEPATKADVEAAIAKAVEPLATKADVEASIDVAIAKAVEPLATKADVEAAIAPLATKAGVEVAIGKATEPLATKADLERYATKADLERYATKADLERYATKADLEAAIEPLATKAGLEAAIRPLATKADLVPFVTSAHLEAWEMAFLDQMEKMIDVTVGRAVNRAMAGMNAWMRAHAEQVSTDVAAANTNTAQLRTELEAHRDDAQLHRAPRGRRP